MTHATLAACTSIAIASSALADVSDVWVEVTVTADNHYAIYTDVDGTMSRIGGNETGAAGAPGPYNWSIAESWSFEAGANLYFAAWSDDSVAQGFLAELDVNGESILTGDDRWRVYRSGLDRDTGDEWPTALEIIGHVDYADTYDLWTETAIGDQNKANTDPWGEIEGIDKHARWIWGPNDSAADVFRGGSDYGEMLVFTFSTLPAPGALALFGIGFMGRRHRRG